MAHTEPVSAFVGCQWVNMYSDWNTAVMGAICTAESHGNVLAIDHNTNGSTDYGLLQINSVHSDMVSELSDLYTPQVNIAVAHKLWLAHGYEPWSSYNSGYYLNFM